MKRIPAPLALAWLLSACGQAGTLEPPEGASLPPPAYGASQSPSAEELLALDPQAAPERSVELRRESEEREDDPFDLPPES